MHVYRPSEGISSLTVDQEDLDIVMSTLSEEMRLLLSWNDLNKTSPNSQICQDIFARLTKRMLEYCSGNVDSGILKAIYMHWSAYLQAVPDETKAFAFYANKETFTTKFSEMMLGCGDFRNQILLLAILVEQGYISALPEKEREHMLKLALCGFKKLSLTALYSELAKQPNSNACQKLVMQINKANNKRQSVFTISFNNMRICDKIVRRRTDIHFNGGPRSIGMFIHLADIVEDEPDDLLYVHVPVSSLTGIKLTEEIYPYHEYFLAIYLNGPVECLNELIGIMIAQAGVIKIQLDSEKDFKYLQRVVGPNFSSPRPQPTADQPTTSAWAGGACLKPAEPQKADDGQQNKPTIPKEAIVVEEEVKEPPTAETKTSGAEDEQMPAFNTQLTEKLMDRIYAAALPSPFRSDSDLEDISTDIDEINRTIELHRTSKQSKALELKSPDIPTIAIDSEPGEEEAPLKLISPKKELSKREPKKQGPTIEQIQVNSTEEAAAPVNNTNQQAEVLKQLERKVSELQQQVAKQRRGKKRSHSSWPEADLTSDTNDDEQPLRSRRKLRSNALSNPGKEPVIAKEALKLPAVEDNSKATNDGNKNFKRPEPKQPVPLVAGAKNSQSYTASTSTPRADVKETPSVVAQIEPFGYQKFKESLSQSSTVNTTTTSTVEITTTKTSTIDTTAKPSTTVRNSSIFDDAIAKAKAALSANAVKLEKKTEAPTTCYGVTKRNVRGRKPKLVPAPLVHRVPLPPGATQDDYVKKAFAPPPVTQRVPSAPRKFFKAAYSHESKEPDDEIK